MQKSILIAALALITVTSFQNCGRRGTETGNPKTTQAYKIVRSICERMSTCNGQGGDVDYCVNNLMIQPGLPASLGVASNTGISTMQDLAYAELSGSITPQPVAASTCQAEVEVMNCSAPTLSSISAAPVAAPAPDGSSTSSSQVAPIVVLPPAVAVSTAQQVFGASPSCSSAF